jgi:hypothetical protein
MSRISPVLRRLVAAGLGAAALSSAAVFSTSLAAAATPATVPGAPVVSKPVVAGKPTAATTGPKSTTLKRHDGNITVTKAGTVLQGLDIHGFVTVKAANVVIRDSIVRGGKATGNAGVITNYGYDNLLVEDVYIKPAHQSVWIDGVKGWDFTLNRVHVVGGVDNVKIHGDDVTIKNSLLESTVYYASDPNQGGGPTHNDSVQILKGRNLTLSGNTIRDTKNFAIMNGAEQGHVTAKITGNWLDGGHCTVKLTHKKGWTNQTTITDNKFGPNRKIAKCVIQSYTGVKATAANNTFDATGKPVALYWNNA